jgi:HD-like signal output (HDOD) protein
LDLFDESEADGGLDYKKFWGEALRTSIIASLLVKKQSNLSHIQPETAFVGALLQDIGLLIMDQYKHEMFVKIQKFSIEKKVFFHTVESKAMGFSHQEVGEYVAEEWKLPTALVKIIGFHHEPIKRIYDKEEFGLLSVVYLAHFLNYGLAEGTDPLAPEFVEECWQEVGLDMASIDLVLSEANELYEGMAKLLFS